MTRPVLDTFALTGKKALVTGGNRGIGYALTQGLAEAGESVTDISTRDGSARSAYGVRIP